MVGTIAWIIAGFTNQKAKKEKIESHVVETWMVET
jgi:hypothetical protein